MIRILILIVSVLLGTAALAQSLTLTNLRGPIAKAAGQPPAKSIRELWAQIDALAARPTPVPSPTPVFEPTPSTAPDLAGLAAIASGADLAPRLQPSWGTGAIPGKEGDGQHEGALRFVCAPGQLSYDDAIVFPGLEPPVALAHLHQYFGNTRADRFSTYRSLRTSGESTCNNLLNRSAYWIPAMMNGAGKVVKPNAIGIYYKRAPQGSKFCAPPYAKACLPLPRGLRYLFGYSMLNPAKSDPAIMRWFNCDAPGVAGQYRTITAAAERCPTGAAIGASIVSPNCWSGRDLDSHDHRSHMAYQDWGDWGYPRCPATHPYLLPFFQASAWYMNDGTATVWHFSSDRMPGMPDLPAGTSFHADWFGAWEDKVQAAWTANCINKALSCSGGDLGDGTQLAIAAGGVADWARLAGRTLLVDAPPPPIGAAVVAAAHH